MIVRRLAPIAIAVVSLYAIAWGLVYLHPDRAVAMFGPGRLTYRPPIPWYEWFPGPGPDTQPLLVAVALLAGVCGLFAAAIVRRGWQKTR